MQKAEEISKELGAHELTLETGKTWETVHFYESIGFAVNANLPNHYHHVDFVLMTKFLDEINEKT